ncbi:unnamed protein product [Closterium sp. NIES-65]|nr:unnamed protein product [Closterium sp. NIES-65]
MSLPSSPLPALSTVSSPCLPSISPRFPPPLPSLPHPLNVQCARYGDMEDVAAALDGGADAGVADDEGRTGEAGECGWGDEGRTGEAGECGWGDEGRTGEAGECGWGDEGRTGEAGECGWGDEGRTGEAGECGWGDEGRTGEAGECGWGDEGRTGEAGECGWGDEGRTGGGGGMRGAQVGGWSEGRIDWGGRMRGAQCAMRTFSAAHVVTSFPHPLPVPCVHTWHNPFPHPLPVPRMNASLHMAAANGHTEIACLLIQRGAVSVFPSTAPSSLALPPWPSPLGPPPLALPPWPSPLGPPHPPNTHFPADPTRLCELPLLRCSPRLSTNPAAMAANAPPSLLSLPSASNPCEPCAPPVYAPSHPTLYPVHHAPLARATLEPGPLVSQPVNAVNRQGNTPLHWAAVNGRDSMVHLLITAGANPSALNSHERTPVDEAIHSNNQLTLDAINTAVATRDAASLTVAGSHGDDTGGDGDGGDEATNIMA